MMENASIQQEISIDNINQHIAWLTEHAPNRISSGGDVVKAAAYIASCLDHYGIDVSIDEFYAYNSTPRYSKFELIRPEYGEFPSLPYGHIRNTPCEGEVAELVYLCAEAYEDPASLPREAIEGRFVLVEMSYAPPVPEKARILSALGAAGIVCMNWGNDDLANGAICNRALKTIWGNPTEETVGDIPEIVGIGVTRRTGLFLKELCLSSEPVVVRVAAIADKVWQKIGQPHGILRSGTGSEEFFLIGSHLDAWEPGVTCNATGNALTIELCRVLALHRTELRRDVRVVFWNGHEIAEAAGSTWYADTYRNILNRGCVAYTHIDSPGLKDAVLYEVKASDELFDFALENARLFTDPAGVDVRMMSLQKIGDQSFMGIGIPAIAQRYSYSEAYMRANGGATLGWWNHTSQDATDKYDERNMALDAAIALSFARRICTEARLPYRFGRRLESASRALGEIEALCKNQVDFSDLREGLLVATKLTAEMESLGSLLKNEEEIQVFNAYAIKISRLLTDIFCTYADKYGQDSYGSNRLSARIPLLSDAGRVGRYPVGSFQRGMIETGLIRNKNRIVDGLNHIADYSRLYLQRLKPPERG